VAAGAPLVKIGIMDHVDDSGLPPSQHYAQRLKLVEAMDRLGFYSYHVAEHHGTPLGLAPSPSVYLSAVAQRTRTLRFGPMVFVAPLYHPMRLAEEICMLDQMSTGRLQLGIGRGAVWLEHEIYDVDPASSAERYAEARDLVLQALTQTTVNFSGKHFRVRNFPMVLRPYQTPRPPLWYGIGNPESAVWAAAHAANVVSLQPAAVARRTLDRYREEWHKLGRADSALPFLGVARHVVVADTEPEARRIARAAYPRWRASFSSLWDKRGVPTPLNLPHEWDALQEAGQSVAGTPATVREYLQAQRATAGASFFLCQMVFGEIGYEEALRSLTLLAGEVAPALE
jgi:alkanesulfonate monooxygenase SsuD/methylene tetrahydromethanopterin reductase-like flavin-dependent oxidoreductase (luciferase family)